MELIKLKQEPIISCNKIAAKGQEVKDQIAALNLENQVATPDTVKSLKKIRADLRKDCSIFEGQRKEIKSALMNPYNAFELEYKNHILSPYKEADSILQSKIVKVEGELKYEKEMKIKSYFDELCASEKIEFIPFETLRLNITLSASEKSLKEACNNAIDTAKQDISMIETQVNKAEIMAEYKQCLNVSTAIKNVTERLKREEEEKAKVQEKTKEVVEPKKEVISAPKLSEQIYHSTFTIKGTEYEIRALREYIENNTKLEIIKK